MKMTRCRLQGGDGEVGMVRWRQEIRDRCWRQGEAKGERMAAGVEEAGPGRGCQAGGGCRWRGKDAEVEIVKWRCKVEEITEKSVKSVVIQEV